MKPRCISAMDFRVGGPAFDTVFFWFSQRGGIISGNGLLLRNLPLTALLLHFRRFLGILGGCPFGLFDWDQGGFRISAENSV